MEEAAERWKEFRRNFATYAEAMEKSFPSMTVSYLDYSRFELILDGLRTNSIPITEIDYNGFGRVTDDNWTRLYELMEALEQNSCVNSLIISCSCIADEGSKPFFKKLASSHCKIQKLFLDLVITEKRAVLFKKALEKNKSIRKLRLTSNTPPILNFLKSNTTITSLKIESATFDAKFIKALKHNRTLEKINMSRYEAAVQSSVNMRNEMCEALASIGTLKSLTIDLGAGPTAWSMQPMIKVLEGNPRLAHLAIRSQTDFIDKYADTELLGQEVLHHQSLPSLNLCHGAVGVIRPLKNTSLLKELTVPISSPIMIDWFADIVTSMTGLQRVNFSEIHRTQQLYINLANLITKESRVAVWRFEYPLYLKRDVFEVLQRRAVRPCCIELLASRQEQLLEFAELTVTNPFLVVKWPPVRELLTDEEMQIKCYKEKKIAARRQSNLLRYKNLYQFLAIIMLAKQEHLFSVLPNEVLLLICKYACDESISSDRLLQAIALAGNREFMLGSNETSHIPKIVRFWMEH